MGYAQQGYPPALPDNPPPGAPRQAPPPPPPTGHRVPLDDQQKGSAMSSFV